MAQLKVRKSGAWVIPSDLKVRNAVGGWDGEQNGKVRVGLLWEAIMSYYTVRWFGTQMTYDWIEERDALTFVRINSADSPYGSPTGLGGTKGRLFNYDDQSDSIYEIDPETLANLGTLRDWGSQDGAGIGGLYNRLFYAEETDNIYELDMETGVTLNYTNDFTAKDLKGCGGMGDRLFVTYDTGSTERVYEIDPDTFVVLHYEASPWGDFAGKIGGGRNRLVMARASEGIIEIDPETLLSIGEYGSSSWGIGGLK